MTVFEKVVNELLLMANPDPLVWGLLLSAIFLIAIFIGRLPAPVSIFLLILVSFTLSAIGGVFYILNLLLIGSVGILLVMAYFKLGNR